MNNKTFYIALIISILFHLWIIPTFLFTFDMKEYQVNERKHSSSTRMTFFHADSFAQSTIERNDKSLPTHGERSNNMSVEDLTFGQKKTLAENIQEEINQRLEDSLPVQGEISKKEKAVEKIIKEIIKEEEPVEPGKETTVPTGKGDPETVQPVKESEQGDFKTQNTEKSKIESSNEKETNEEIKTENMKLSIEEKKIDSFPSIDSDINLLNESNQSKEEKQPLDLTQSDFLDEQVIPPRVVTFSPPDYPEHLRKREIEGHVLLKVLIDKEGKAIQAEIGKSSGYRAFDQAAIESVYQWQFTPAQFGKRIRESWVSIPMVFHLE